jgi:hypothetical protein
MTSYNCILTTIKWVLDLRRKDDSLTLSLISAISEKTAA